MLTKESTSINYYIPTDTSEIQPMKVLRYYVSGYSTTTITVWYYHYHTHSLRVDQVV